MALTPEEIKKVAQSFMKKGKKRMIYPLEKQFSIICVNCPVIIWQL